MIAGALGGLLIGIVYTLITGRLQLTKGRIVYGSRARLVALAGLIPFVSLLIYIVATGATVTKETGLQVFFILIGSSVAILYGLGWPMGEPPR
jgi:hypothetical protein